MLFCTYGDWCFKQKTALSAHLAAILYWTVSSKPSPQRTFLAAPLLPDGIVGSTEVDEEVPAPVPHGQQISHAAKIHG